MSLGREFRPAVFVGQPGAYENVNAPGLMQWEQQMVRDLGMDAPIVGMQPKEWVRGECISGSDNGWDDSDQY